MPHWCGCYYRFINLKRKASRLRDWNTSITAYGTRVLDIPTWKEKHLDYEIETIWKHSPSLRCQDSLKRKASRLRDWNRSTTRVPSIAVVNLKRKASRLRDWNVGEADGAGLFCETENLEKKSISITRLKLRSKPTRPLCLTPSAWKEKHLDYEIETMRDTLAGVTHGNILLEKKSISITRLKPPLPSISNKPCPLGLKRKASRLRDWNSPI